VTAEIKNNSSKTSNATTTAIFSIEKIYIKDLSVEVPNAPQIFLNREQPAIELKLNLRHALIAEASYNVSLRAQVNAKVATEVVFLVDIEQSGIFRIQNISTEQLDRLLSVDCPNILFPYLREAIASAVTHAGFMPLMLAPINFAYQRLSSDNSTSVDD
jgi:preprotein translocase subunit SecB